MVLIWYSQVLHTMHFLSCTFEAEYSKVTRPSYSPRIIQFPNSESYSAHPHLKMTFKHKYTHTKTSLPSFSSLPLLTFQKSFLYTALISLLLTISPQKHPYKIFKLLILCLSHKTVCFLVIKPSIYWWSNIVCQPLCLY